jgi:hypothetical protein
MILCFARCRVSEAVPFDGTVFAFCKIIRPTEIRVLTSSDWGVFFLHILHWPPLYVCGFLTINNGMGASSRRAAVDFCLTAYPLLRRQRTTLSLV